MALDRDSLERYYDLLEETLRNNEIFDDPTRIFNCDETGMPLNPKPLKVVSEVGTKNPCNITGNLKNQITVLACTSAAGYLLPPFVVFDRKTLTKELTKGEVPGASYGLSTKGCMDGEFFKDWFIGHFLSYAPACRPLLLLLDGHKSHFCPEVIRTAATEGVIVFALPPNTTHLSQPLDKGAFAPLKIEWRKVVQNFISRNPGRDITRYDFSALFAKAWNKAMTLANIVAGFRVTGVCPFNRNAIRLPSEESTKFNPEALPKSTGIKYIPLYSPARNSKPNFDKANSTDVHDKCTERKSAPVISPVKHDKYQELDTLDCSLTPYSPYSSTPVELCSRGRKNPSLDDLSFRCGSLSLDQTLERSNSEPSLHKCSPMDFTLMDYGMNCFLPAEKQPSLGKFLHTPRPPSKLPIHRPKSSGRVLTSLENLRMMEEREHKKKEEARLKEEQKKAREEKKFETMRIKEERKKAREEKAKQKGENGKEKKKMQSTYMYMYMTTGVLVL